MDQLTYRFYCDVCGVDLSVSVGSRLLFDVAASAV
jgi:hypothetical protein